MECVKVRAKHHNNIQSWSNHCQYHIKYYYQDKHNFCFLMQQSLSAALGYNQVVPLPLFTNFSLLASVANFAVILHTHGHSRPFPTEKIKKWFFKAFKSHHDPLYWWPYNRKVCRTLGTSNDTESIWETIANTRFVLFGTSFCFWKTKTKGSNIGLSSNIE